MSPPNRIGPSKRRRAQDPSRVTLRGLIVVAVLLALGYVGIRAYSGVPLKSYKSLYVTASGVGNLREHDQVRIAGRRVGQVQHVDLKADGTARVKLQIEPSTQALPADTTTSIRAAGLLGARYVELTPGTSTRKLGDGATIDGGTHAKTFGLPEALDTFDAPTRKRGQQLTNAMGQGLSANGPRLNDATHRAADAQQPFAQIVDSLFARRGSVQAFVPSADAGFAPLDAARNDLAALFPPTSRAVRPFADRSSSVDALLRVAPGSLAAARQGLTDGNRLLDATDALATAIHGTLPAAPAGLNAATRLLRKAPATLPAGTKLLGAVRGTVPDALQTVRDLSPVLGPLGRALDYLVPLNQRVGRYACDITNFGAVFRSMTGLSSPGVKGPGGQFRLQVSPSPGEALGIKDDSPLTPRDPYPEPCTYTGARSVTEPLGGN